jgi:hypothetical protein
MKTTSDVYNQTSVLIKSLGELLQRYETVKSFNDAQEWNQDANTLVNSLEENKSDLLVVCDGLEKKLAESKQERNSKSIFQRVLSSHSDENKITEAIKQTNSIIQRVEGYIEDLSEKVEKTPTNKLQQKEIANELKALKQELTLQKREINKDLRQTRANARTKTASWTGVRSGMLGSIARNQRTSIRIEKERALVPLENQKSFIEEKLIDLERDINWVMHFDGDDQKIKNQRYEEEIIVDAARKCKYCGRTVIGAADVCPGCGASL